MKKFKSRIGVERTQQFLDTLGRYAWEPFRNDEPGFPKNQHGGPYFDHTGTPVALLWEVMAKSSGSFRGALMSGGGKLPAGGGGTPPPNGMDIAVPGGWTQFEFAKIIDVIASDGVTSVADAVLKSMAYQQIIASTKGPGIRYYLFRGQSQIKHTVIPRLGRVIAEEIKAGSPPPADASTVTPRELADLSKFQIAWPPAAVDPLDLHSFGALPPDDGTWWMLMQHYADSFGDGSRLLDVTTSPLFALLFACVEWETGKIDTESDGIVYIFIEGENAIVQDYLEKAPSKCDQLFNANHDVRQMVVNPPHNERSKAQGGGFIWWREFWKPLNGTLPYLRVPGDCKESIAAELLSIGVGPKEAVRGKKGLDNEKTLRALLG